MHKHSRAFIVNLIGTPFSCRRFLPDLIRRLVDSNYRQFPIVLLFLSLWLPLLSLAETAGAGVTHELAIRLDPENHRLFGRDRITLSEISTDQIIFTLSPRAEIRHLTVNDTAAEHHILNNQVVVAAPPENTGASIQLQVDYTAVFDDSFPEAPANTDNPGFGVTGIIGKQGTFILSNAAWYPQFAETASKVSLTVDAPKGMVAVTSGRSAGRRTEKGRTLSFWEVNHPVEALALSAGPYIVTESDAAGIQVATYFLPETQPLSSRYIAAVKKYLKLYSELFGPYPFEKFAVVENFFPTGYGFPSYTLMGGRVLRLPFIIDVSLGHEIAHCWWGNGVRVDDASGNWSEGLTTYVADYLYKEKASASAAESYRRQWLRDYATLVKEEADFPLSEFVSRTDRVTRVVGYDKSAMVFHMLRQMLGEKVFWGSLRDIYKAKLFQKISWEDFRLAFQQRAGHGPCCNLEEFFVQWVNRAGAPQLALESVRRLKKEKEWRVTGSIVQRQTQRFDIPVTLTIKTEQGVRAQQVSLHKARTAFHLNTQDRPTAVALDPDVNLFRRLFPEEIPAAINTLKGADSVWVVISKSAGEAGVETAQMLIRSLSLSAVKIVREDDLQAADHRGISRIYIGFPAHSSILTTPHDEVTLFSHGISIAEKSFSNASDTFFGVFQDPHHQGTVVGILYPVHSRFGPLVARKATHYGKYSYLLFSQGENVVKGVWSVTDSPLVVRWE